MDYQWKPGQTVALYHGSGVSSTARKMTIARVTKSGRAVIHLSQYHKNGNMVGRGDWSSARIEPWTAEHDAEVEADRKQRLGRHVRSFLEASQPHFTPDEIIEAVRAALAAKATESLGAPNTKG